MKNWKFSQKRIKSWKKTTVYLLLFSGDYTIPTYHIGHCPHQVLVGLSPSNPWMVDGIALLSHFYIYIKEETSVD